jgi:hypothetical protein
MALLLVLLWLVHPAAGLSSQRAWHLTLEVTGGLAGVDRHLGLSSSGDLEVADRRRSTSTTARLFAAELGRIDSLVAALQPMDAVRSTGCFDCFNYSLEVDRSGSALAFQLNDFNVAGTSVEPLLRALTALLDRELSSRPPDARGPRGQ